MSVYVVDPDLDPDMLRDAIGGTGEVYTIFNPHQADVIDINRLAPPCAYEARDARLCFERVETTLAAAKTAGAGKVALRGLDLHEIDLASILEAGWGVDVHAGLACRLGEVEPTSARIITERAEFAAPCASHLRQRGFDVTVARPRSTRAAPNSRIRRAGSALGAVARMAAGWMSGKARVYGAEHRQTRSVLDELRRRSDLAIGNPRLSSAVGLFTRSLSTPSSAELSDVSAALHQLQQFGEERLEGVDRIAWRHLVASPGDDLVGTVAQLATQLTNLDILAPDFLIAPNWAGLEAHVLRAWAASTGRPFAVIQHGFNLGAWNCPVSGLIDADIYYAWSPWFVQEWIDEERNRDVEIVPLGNPTYEGVRRRRPSEPRSILVAPSGVHTHGSASLRDFWNGALQAIDNSSDGLTWRLRPHRLGGSSTWIRNRAAALGAEWSTEGTFGEALHGVDIVVTTVSSTAVDAIVHGAIAVVVNAEQREPFFLPDVVGAYLTRPEELEGTLRELMSSPDACRAARDKQQFTLDQHVHKHPVSEIAADIRRRLQTQ